MGILPRNGSETAHLAISAERRAQPTTNVVGDQKLADSLAAALLGHFDTAAVERPATSVPDFYVG
jgi:hypothetical protein